MFNTIDEIKFANKNAGFHFFSEGAMYAFDSRISKNVYGGRFFVTSELNFDKTARVYTLRMANSDGSIETIGEFGQYATLRAAKRAAMNCARYLANFLKEDDQNAKERAEILLEGVATYENYFAN